jgi:hypothetical protein
MKIGLMGMFVDGSCKIVDLMASKCSIMVVAAT